VTEAASARPAAVPAGAVVPRWGLGDAALGWFVVQVFALVWLAVTMAATGHPGEELDAPGVPLTVVAVAQLGLALGFFAVPYAVTRLKGNGIVVDLGFRARWSDTWYGGIPGLLTQLVVIPLLYWPLLRMLDKTAGDLEGPARSLSDKADGLGGVVLLVLIVGVLAPVFEELFYRGLVQRAFLKHGFSPVVSVGATALVFGASHLQLLQLPGLVLAGVVFGVLAYRADRLGPSIAAHVAFNMVTVVALLTA
jgi:membrane protease YdiL (CAAX protease family)